MGVVLLRKIKFRGGFGVDMGELQRMMLPVWSGEITFLKDEGSVERVEGFAL